MVHPRHHAQINPEKLACICPETGQSLTYGALEAVANQGAQLLRDLGLQSGDVIAAMLDNEIAAFGLTWAAERSGVYLTSVPTRLSVADATYIVADCGARLLVVSDALASIGEQIKASLPHIQAFRINEAGPGLASWRDAAATRPTTPIADESPGADMLYSSGTTGRPKGVKPALPTGLLGDEPPMAKMGRELYGMAADTIYLSTSPLYHAAPLRWAMAVHYCGGTIVLMRKFDAEAALKLIEAYRVTHSTWVPTHFVRLLRLPEDVRRGHDLSSMRAAIHAGAPCPVPVKQAMISWWGPIIFEYYSGTEMCGITALSSEEWAQKPGSVGKAVLGLTHILDDDGHELSPGEIGQVWFSDGPSFEYHNDPSKTAAAHNPQGWATLGDIGSLDADGYLYLTDRKNFMIISGGVNVYPQEIENLLVTHPKVADVAVVGAPDDEMGEVVVGVVQPAPGVAGDEHLANELREFARQHLGSIKAPKRFEFRDDLPREPTGKLLKAKLVAEFRDRR